MSLQELFTFNGRLTKNGTQHLCLFKSTLLTNKNNFLHNLVRSTYLKKADERSSANTT